MAFRHGRVRLRQRELDGVLLQLQDLDLREALSRQVGHLLGRREDGSTRRWPPALAVALKLLGPYSCRMSCCFISPRLFPNAYVCCVIGNYFVFGGGL